MQLGWGYSRFAVTTPGSVELYQDVLVAVEDDLFVGVSDNDGDRTFLLLGDRLRLDAGLDLAIHVVLNELSDLFLGHLGGRVEGELLVLAGILDGESGPFANLEVEVSSMSSKRLRIDGRKADNAFVLFSYGLQSLCKLRSFFGGLGKNIGEGNASLGQTH